MCICAVLTKVDNCVVSFLWTMFVARVCLQSLFFSPVFVIVFLFQSNLKPNFVLQTPSSFYLALYSMRFTLKRKRKLVIIIQAFRAVCCFLQNSSTSNNLKLCLLRPFAITNQTQCQRFDEKKNFV